MGLDAKCVHIDVQLTKAEAHHTNCTWAVCETHLSGVMETETEVSKISGLKCKVMISSRHKSLFEAPVQFRISSFISWFFFSLFFLQTQGNWYTHSAHKVARVARSEQAYIVLLLKSWKGLRSLHIMSDKWISGCYENNKKKKKTLWFKKADKITCKTGHQLFSLA